MGMSCCATSRCREEGARDSQLDEPPFGGSSSADVAEALLFGYLRVRPSPLEPGSGVLPPLCRKDVRKGSDSTSAGSFHVIVPSLPGYGAGVARHRYDRIRERRRTIMNELERFIDIWENETRKTLALFDALPRDRYDFRPDPDGRSLGEMAWHIAEGEAFGPFAIERGSFSRDARPEGLERPRTTPELRLAFERVHRDALARVRKMKEADLDRSIP